MLPQKRQTKYKDKKKKNHICPLSASNFFFFPLPFSRGQRIKKGAIEVMLFSTLFPFLEHMILMNRFVS